MDVKQLLDTGNLSDAIHDIKQAVKNCPTDVGLRTSLFELTCFEGAWESAARQLDVMGLQDPAMEQATEIYKYVLQAEKERRKAIEGELSPKSLTGETPPLFAQLEKMFALLRELKISEAKAVCDEIQQKQPVCSGKLDGEPFEEILDGDDRFAPIVEAFFHQWYVWIPFEQISRMTIQAPKHLRDLLWIPTEVEIREASTYPVFLPVVYPGSWESSDGQIQLGRKTVWNAPGADLVIGLGQRMWMIDGKDRGILECHQVEFNASGSPS